jgi:hypothetical protein
MTPITIDILSEYEKGYKIQMEPGINRRTYTNKFNVAK